MKRCKTDWSVDFGICRSKSNCCQKPTWSTPKLWKGACCSNGNFPLLCFRITKHAQPDPLLLTSSLKATKQYEQNWQLCCGGKVMLRLFKDSRKSISWSAQNKHLTGNIIIRPWRFVSCWAQTSLTKEKKRKNIEREEKERGKVKKGNDCFHSFFFYRPFWSS